MPFRNHWRDVQTLHQDGIPIDTTSDETAKLFDAALTQYTGWYNDDSLGGVDACLTRLLTSDPNCLTGRILATGLDLMGTASPSSSLKTKTLKSLGETKSTNRYVQYHCLALIHFASGEYRKASETWEQCLIDYPFDMMSIKFVGDAYFYSGNREMLRDSIARVLPIWENSSDRPLKSYLYGMYAFGLGETNLVERSEKEALKGLELNCDDGWATHALAHSLEYQGRMSDGIDFLKKTQNEWRKCQVIRPHIEWHSALYHVEQGNCSMAEEILFEQILSRDSDMIMLDFVDIAALIYRLRLSGHGQSKMFSSNRLKTFLNEHLHDHVLLFNDLHMNFILDDYVDENDRIEFYRTLKETFEESTLENAKVYQTMGKFLFEAMEKFKEKNYSQVVDLIYPIRNEIYQIGGSNAQRDIFNLLLIHSAVYSSNPRHQLLAKQLLNERCLLRNKTSSRLMENYAAAIHHD